MNIRNTNGYFVLFAIFIVTVSTAPGFAAVWQNNSTTPKPNSTAEASDDDSEKTAKESDGEVDELAEILEGHSFHGGAFNEGPRQKAYLIGGTGNVSFPVTTESPQVQAFINQGVGQLHGFWDLEAERSFRQAIALDENCAIAYWGAALATVTKRKRAQGFIAKAVELREGVTEREKMYIDAADKFLKDKKGGDAKKRAAAYLKDLESIVIKYPDDIEAKAFVCHRVWANGRAGIPVSSYLATEALLKQIYDVEPLHPAHHYSIHLWDYRHPENALKSAARCGVSAPAIAHMWHMPGHIYSRLKRYEDAVFQQEASARIDHAYMIRDRVLPDEIHNFAHNNEWLIRNLIFIGAANRAIDLAKNMTSLPKHPKYNMMEKRGSFSYGRRRLLQSLREFQMFDQAVALCQSSYLNIPGNTQEHIKTLRLLGCAASYQGDTETATKARTELAELLQTNKDVVSKSPTQIKHLEVSLDKSSDRPPFPRPLLSTSETLKEDISDAKKKLSKAKRSSSAIEKALMAIDGYTAFAKDDFETAHAKLKKAAGEDVSWIGELQYLSGQTEDGLETLTKQVDRRKKETIPLARLVYALSQESGDENQEKLKTRFEQLRETSSSIDLNAPVFSRLGPIAKKLGYGENWLATKTKLADTGFRPPLNSLGPFRWSAPKCPSWKLPTANDSMVDSSEFHGKPHIVIFYLGSGCLHCAEQLQAFGPRVTDFEELGIDMVVVSSDQQSGLSEAVSNFEGEMPYQWHLADGERKVFKKFRAYDDFEDQPLHGTFLVDGQGRIRWQDISYEPFMDHEFLMKEAKRLLSQNRESDNIDSAISGN